MTYTPLLVVLGVLVLGAGVTLTVLFRADRAGLFRRLSAGAFVLFDEAEPLGIPQDQLFAPGDAPSDASAGRHPLTRTLPTS
ncbi:MAG: hypothetical protein ABJF88_08250 [Rhodothermales bacterium]